MNRASAALLLATSACVITAAPAPAPPIANTVVEIGAPEPALTLWQDEVAWPVLPGVSRHTLAARSFAVRWTPGESRLGYAPLRAAASRTREALRDVADHASTDGTPFRLGDDLPWGSAPPYPPLTVDMVGYAYLRWASPEVRRADLIERAGDGAAVLSWPVSTVWMGNPEATHPIAALAGTSLWLALFVDQDWDSSFDPGEWALIELTFA